uniref:StAR related lipid transfer domain containing 3 n=1 Tax=Equus asinus TaxID=9793 RepID=A0A8C4L307_EQUAS
MNKPSGELARDLERSLPAVASLSSSLSHSQTLSSHLLPPPPEKRRAISDVRRTFCLFVTFDLLFVSLLWIIELNTKTGIQKNLEQEIIHYNFKTSFFDIFVLAFFRFSGLLLGYAVLRLRHWWVIAVTTLVSSAFLIVKVILSEGILLPRLLLLADPSSSPALCLRASSIHPQNPLQGLTMNQKMKSSGRKASLPRNGNTFVRGRRPQQWWTRSWPRRKTGSSRRIMNMGTLCTPLRFPFMARRSS